MKAAIKFVLVTLVAAVLSVGSLSACANSLKAQSTSDHACCPGKHAPLPEDCARPGCIYMDTHQVPPATTQLDDAGMALEAPVIGSSIAVQPAVIIGASRLIAPMVLSHRYVAFHQFLI